MQLLSPVQFVLVLWLLAAAAPAATVLMNGCFLPTVNDSAVSSGQTAQVSRGGEHRVSGSCCVARLFAEQAAEETLVMAALDATSFVARSAETSFQTPASSVLQTGVQRHRPRGV